MPKAYYNENDPAAAAWLRNLIARGLIAPGDVDDRSIADVQPADLVGYAQCHFFAGIGGWSYALRIAGWPDERPVWTGSCPCQPFSAAGKGAAYADERHLWPHWRRLIGERRPSVIFGEQVAAAIRTGWLDDVCLSLESLGYAVGAVDFPACGVGAPHIRQRCYFVADADGNYWRADGGESHARTDGRRLVGGGRATRAVADADRAGSFLGQPNGEFWRDAEWIACRDGKARPVEPGTFPLADGVPARMVRLRGYGNAIVPQQAAAFIAAYRDGI